MAPRSLRILMLNTEHGWRGGEHQVLLLLHRHQAGTLPQLARYLHQRTGGMIGSLLWLIRSAAIQAVIDGTEQITRKAMDTLQADIASQSAASSLASRVSSGSACG